MATYQVQPRDGKYVVVILNEAGEITDMSAPSEQDAAKVLRDQAEAAGVVRLSEILTEKPVEEAKPVAEKAAPAEPAPKAKAAVTHAKPAPAASKSSSGVTFKSHR